MEVDWGPAGLPPLLDHLHPHQFCPNMRHPGENNFCRFCRRKKKVVKLCLCYNHRFTFFSALYSQAFCCSFHYRATFPTAAFTQISSEKKDGVTKREAHIQLWFSVCNTQALELIHLVFQPWSFKTLHNK